MMAMTTILKKDLHDGCHNIKVTAYNYFWKIWTNDFGVFLLNPFTISVTLYSHPLL